MSKLPLQLESERKASARSEHTCIEYQAKTDLAQTLKLGIEEFPALGKDSRQPENKDHPQGQRPDAFSRLLTFRLSQVILKDKQKLEAANSNRPSDLVAETAQAVNTVTSFGTQAAHMDPKVNVAKRCFDAELVAAFRQLQKTQCSIRRDSTFVTTSLPCHKPRKAHSGWHLADNRGHQRER